MIILTVNAKNRPQTIKKAINHLIVGGIVAAKADTSYALLVLPRFLENHRILNKIKNARHNKQYSLFVAKKDDIISKIPEQHHSLADKLLPGQVTIVYDKKRPGLRLIDSETITSLISSLKTPLTATSANPSDLAPARNAQEVEAYFNHLPILVLDEGEVPTQKSSTIIDLTGPKPKVLRRGAVSLSSLVK